MMRFIYTPKHQKLVNNCYPNGRTTDKKPKSSETAYLLYYVNSRRSKLEKVSSYMVKRSSSDLRNRRVGNISVTLALLDRIVIHCKENLNIFVKDFIFILNRILQDVGINNDVSILELIADVFKSICENIDDSLCSGDTEFVKMFQDFTKLYFNIVKDQLHNDDLLLRGCLNISYTTCLAGNPKLCDLITKSVHYTLLIFQEKYPNFKTTSLHSAASLPLTKKLSRTHTRTGISLTDGSLASDASITVLKSYFNTTETDKLTLALRAVLAQLQVTPNKELLELICEGIPVQLRYIVIILLVRQLSEKSTNYDTTLKLISSLLVSNVSIIGLSVLDIMRKLLAFQLENAENDNIVHECYTTISDLNEKIYYHEQTSDMLYELLTRLRIDTSQINKSILVNDVINIIRNTSNPCIGLDLFLELVPFINDDINNVLSLFDIVDDQIATGFLFSTLFKIIVDMSRNEEQGIMMRKVFNKFSNIALLSGLNYFLEIYNEPEPAYYYYHEEAATFLNLDDYKVQTKYKMENGLLFSSDDLMNFYSDAGTNKYSKRGIQIILSQGPSHLSSFDLTTDSNMTRSLSESVQRSFSGGVIGQPSTAPTPTTSSAMLGMMGLSSDSKSLNNFKGKSPKIKDLRIAFKKNPSGQDKENTILGTESLKSRVTNITFLLSELKSISTEVNKIQDPDEDEIVGLDKIDLARSNSLKLTPATSIASNKNRLQTDKENEEDNFKDATEDFELPGSRGKLFASI
ncbi:hypothetical protein Kpol_413p4 [Vanderwaltozyma polyspora DSM 70294]|uniref:Protein EFR3 n=1 Tax=Vanderwaltozyma polyspora (strain ATCC 22028 / DSM 70294 / BCRC 21397 / CBS 2163 / NBRC 10782 / NRRL Y-8283 / UCD 57-17) TaxID=436907 RepID=A7TRG9_VANPO|nr:uncharacterized protein Kpol_413p4 [Vanderwaltozyma polyspora DSM 70294]EDO15129.1 hypothetical protein Kpol_413p4 [Vanderwaltozyma polyspora DSM 70294]